MIRSKYRRDRIFLKHLTNSKMTLGKYRHNRSFFGVFLKDFRELNINVERSTFFLGGGGDGMKQNRRERLLVYTRGLSEALNEIRTSWNGNSGRIWD